MGNEAGSAGQAATGKSLSGGCQCGKLRFAASQPFAMSCLCHCRMCQKATGSPFSAYVQVSKLTWTRGGAPKYFNSSAYAARGFCADCGTPLSYEPQTDLAAVSIAAFDTPDAPELRPTKQYTQESRLSWVGGIADLEWHGTRRTVESKQHPDHDTDSWPP